MERKYILVSEGNYVEDGETLYVVDNASDFNYIVNKFADSKKINVEDAENHVRLNSRADHVYKLPDLYFSNIGYTDNMLDMVCSATTNQIKHWQRFEQ